MSQITVKVNQEQVQIPASQNLQEFIQARYTQTQGLAVGINQKVIKKADWPTLQLQEGDDILIIQATCGG